MVLLGPDGTGATVGKTESYWLCSDDFLPSDVQPHVVEQAALGALGFPRNWPQTYSQSAALKSLIGKKGRIPACRVAVAGVPTPEELARLPQGLKLWPLHSFSNAESAAASSSVLRVVQGWTIYERSDQPMGTSFVAERYWWNSFSDSGAWIDLTPRPSGWQQLLLAEVGDGSGAKQRSVLTVTNSELHALLMSKRFPDFRMPKQMPIAASSPKSNAKDTPQHSKVQQPVTKEIVSKEASQSKETAKHAEPSISKNSSPLAAKSKPQKNKGLDYSKFDNIEDSDDEKIVAKPLPLTLPIGVPREAVTRDEYEKVWRALLTKKDLPFTPAPDLEQMWGYYKYGGTDEQALLDQACEVVGKFQMRLEAEDWKNKTYSLTKKLEMESREDEARMWSIIGVLRLPKDADPLYNHGVLLNKMCDKAKFSGAPQVRLPSLDGAESKLLPVEQYCSLFSRAAIAYYRRALKVDPKQRPAYINLIGCMERNEPAGWYQDVHEIAVNAVKNGIWYNMWQRPPHFVTSLAAKPWHVAGEFEMCRQLEQNYQVIRDEYDAYINRLINRKDWDDSDTTPGLGDVGARPGALHDGGLTKSGKWKEVPLFTNGTLQREYAEYFPETVRILQTHCRDATGLAFCGGGDVIFSVLTPGTRLRPHCGPSNARLTCHMGVRVPRTRQQGSFIRVAADEARGWEEGRCIVFDDSFEHEVVYDKSESPILEDRVVLLANFWHPDFGFKNDPQWRERSDEMMASCDVESLPQTAVMKT